MSRSTSTRESGRIRARWLVLGGAVLFAAAGAAWWKVSGPARLGKLVATKIEEATGVSTRIASATIEDRTIQLREAELAKEDEWSASLATVNVRLRDGIGLSTLKASLDSIEEVEVVGGEVSFAETERAFDVHEPLSKLRESGKLRTAPMSVRDVRLKWTGENAQSLHLDSMALSAAGSGRLRLTVAGDDSSDSESRLSAWVQVNEDGTDLLGHVEVARIDLRRWLPTGAVPAKQLGGSLDLECESLVVEEPRLEIEATAKLREALPSHSRWPKELGAVTGTCRAEGAVVIADPVRAAIDGSFVGLAESVPAVKASMYLQTVPRKSVVKLVLHDLELPPLFRALRPEAKQAVTAGRGRIELKARRVNPDDGSDPVGTFEGKCDFREATVRLQDRTYDKLSGTTTFSGRQDAETYALSQVDATLNPQPGVFQALAIRWVPEGDQQSRWSFTFRGLRMREAMRAMAVKAGPYPLGGTASGGVSFASRESQLVAGSLRGSGQLGGVSLRNTEWGAITNGSGTVTLHGPKVTLRGAKGLWGQSWLRSRGDIRWKPSLSVDLGVRCADLKYADAQRFASLGAVKLPRYDRPTMKCDLQIKGRLDALQGHGTVWCVALPVNKRLLGDALTASFTVKWLPSPLKDPKLRVTQQKVRVNLVPGIQQIWKGLTGLG